MSTNPSSRTRGALTESYKNEISSGADVSDRNVRKRFHEDGIKAHVRKSLETRDDVAAVTSSIMIDW